MHVVNNGSKPLIFTVHNILLTFSFIQIIMKNMLFKLHITSFSNTQHYPRKGTEKTFCSLTNPADTIIQKAWPSHYVALCTISRLIIETHFPVCFLLQLSWCLIGTDTGLWKSCPVFAIATVYEGQIERYQEQLHLGWVFHLPSRSGGSLRSNTMNSVMLFIRRKYKFFS